MGIVGSLEPVERLLDSYSNNSEDRKNLIVSQLTSNPFDIELPESSEKPGNDNMMLNAYLNSMGLGFEKNYPDDKFDRINGELNSDDIVLLGKVLEMYNDLNKELDPADFIENKNNYIEELKEYEEE